MRIQTLIMVDLEDNRISAKGAQNIADALQYNTVGHIFFSPLYLDYRQHRHWPRLISRQTKSEEKEQSIWLKHYKRTRCITNSRFFPH